MRKLFGALATALMLMTAQAASAATTFSFSFSGIASGIGAFSATGVAFADDGTRTGDATAYLVTGAEGEVDLGTAGKRTIQGVGTISDGQGGQTINAIVNGDNGDQAFQLLFTFVGSDDLALFTLDELATTASFLIDGEPSEGSLEYDVSAVPEPASWAMLLLGFAIAGAALRRRRTPAAAFA